MLGPHLARHTATRCLGRRCEGTPGHPAVGCYSGIVHRVFQADAAQQRVPPDDGRVCHQMPANGRFLQGAIDHRADHLGCPDAERAKFQRGLSLHVGSLQVDRPALPRGSRRPGRGPVCSPRASCCLARNTWRFYPPLH